MGDSLLASLRCKSRCGATGRGVVWTGEVWPSAVRCGEATADDLSTEGFGPLCWVLRNPDAVWPGADGSGRSRKGGAWLGEMRQGNRCRRQHWGLRLPLLLSLRVGVVRSGLIDSGVVDRGLAYSGEDEDCRRQYGGFSLPTVLSGTGMVWSGQQRPARVRSGEAKRD